MTTGLRYVYQGFGLRVASDLELPEMVPSAGDAAADIQIEFGSVPEELESPVTKGVIYQAAPTQFHLRMDRVARYLVTDGRHILVESVPGTTRLPANPRYPENEAVRNALGPKRG